MANTGQPFEGPRGNSKLSPYNIGLECGLPWTKSLVQERRTAVLLWYFYGTITTKPLQYGGPNNTRQLSARNLSLRILY